MTFDNRCTIQCESKFLIAGLLFTAGNIALMLMDESTVINLQVLLMPVFAVATVFLLCAIIDIILDIKCL